MVTNKIYLHPQWVVIRGVAASLCKGVHCSGESTQIWRDQHPIDADSGFRVAKTMEGCLILGAWVEVVSCGLFYADELTIVIDNVGQVLW